MTAELLAVLNGETTKAPPVWFMRQAGRYLPEYRALRESCSNFVEFCLTPKKAAEATLQPIKRFGFDAAILFSDILMIPHGLGQEVRFEAGEGPILGPLPSLFDMQNNIDKLSQSLAPVYEAILLIKQNLDPDTPLIGFCGGPWTVMTYMLNGKKAHDRTLIRSFIYDDRKKCEALLEIIIQASAHYLAHQVKAGAQVLKIFESWAEGFADPLFDIFVTQAHKKLIQKVRDLGVTVPIIGFPRGAECRLEDYLDEVNLSCLALGTATPLKLGARLQLKTPIQGALDPVCLRSGGGELDEMVDRIINAWGNGPFIFNLGHGIFPDTPISHVEQVLKRIRG